MRHYLSTLAVVMIMAAPAAVHAQADAPSSFQWTNETELSFVSTSGNSSSNTFGLKGSLGGADDIHELSLEFGGVRASSERTTRRAIGTPSDFDIEETTSSETTAESYFARTRYDRSFDRSFVFGGIGWDRNTFAGIENRLQLQAGFGRTFVRSDEARLRADLGGTYTFQEDVDSDNGATDGFGGWRVSVDAMRSVSGTAQVNSELVVDNNLEESEDLRVDWLNSLSVSINSALALKTSVQLLWDNQPALVRVPLEEPDGTPVGVDVFTPSDELDTVVTVTLVVRL